MVKLPRLSKMVKLSGGGELSPPSVYQPITGWLTKILGKFDLHVYGKDFTTLLFDGCENAAWFTRLCRALKFFVKWPIELFVELLQIYS